MSRSARLLTCLVMASSLTFAACSPPGQVDSETKVDTSATASVAATTAESSATASSTANDTAQPDPVEFTEAYVRAMPADADMTAIFGELTNTGSEEVTIESFTATIDAKSFEMHEVVDGKMQEKQGGFTLAPGETLVLQPGHEHFMVLGVTSAVEAGDSVDLEITLSDGSVVEVADVPVRTVAAGDEEYAPSHENH